MAVGAVSLVVGCGATSGSRIPGTRAASSVGPKRRLYSDGDGLTCETRVIVRAATEPGGIAAESNWLFVKYPGHKIESQALGQCGEAVADIVTITTADGRSLKIHFDVSSFLQSA